MQRKVGDEMIRLRSIISLWLKSLKVGYNLYKVCYIALQGLWVQARKSTCLWKAQILWVWLSNVYIISEKCHINILAIDNICLASIAEMILRLITGMPCSIALYCTVLHRCYVFTNWKQDPPGAKILWLTLLRCSLHGGGLELNPQYLGGMPVVFPEKIRRWCCYRDVFFLKYAKILYCTLEII